MTEPDDRDPPTISELIADLEEIREEHGDLPVVYVEEIWHVYPRPSVEGEPGPLRHPPETNISEKRVEL